MFELNWLRRAVTTVTAVSAVTTALVSVAPAAQADSGDPVTITIVTPDPDDKTVLCTTTASIGVDTRGIPTVRETGFATVYSTGCGSVSWTPAIVVNDSSSPTYPWYADSDTTAPGNPVTVETSQDVRYGLGVREAGIITVHFEADSRLGHLCYEYRTEFDAVTWTRKGDVTYPCAT